jgi:hypothetical protein
MALDPGTIQGEEVQVGSKTYVWDGIKWNLKAVETVVDTLHVQLANPINYRSGRLNLDADGYPEPDGLTTQSGANEYMQVATEWLKNNGGGDGTILMQSNLPDVTQYDDGALWVDDTTYKLYVLEGDNWIELTQSFDDTIQTLSGYLKRSEFNLEMTAYDTRVIADQKFALQAYMTHMLQTNGGVQVHNFNGPEFDNIIRRLIDVERHQIYIEDKLDELLNSNEGHPPAELTSGQWTYVGYAQGNPGTTNWGTSFLVNDFTQISQVTINENSIGGRVFDLSLYEVGDIIDIHRYTGSDPVIGADYNVSAAFRITSIQLSTGWGRFDVEIVPNSHHGTVQLGDNFSFEKRRAG